MLAVVMVILLSLLILVSFLQNRTVPLKVTFLLTIVAIHISERQMIRLIPVGVSFVNTFSSQGTIFTISILSLKKVK